MKLRKASTGHGDVPLRGGCGAPPCTFFSLSASAKAFLKASEEGSRFEIRSQYNILKKFIKDYRLFNRVNYNGLTYFLYIHFRPRKMANVVQN